MKKNVMLVVAMMIGTIVFAQQGEKEKHKGHHKGPRTSEVMKTELSLDDNQYATIKGIDKKYGEKHAALRKDSTQAKKDKFAAMSELRKEREKEINSVLTPAQKTKWDGYKAERKVKHEAKMKEHAEKRNAEVKKELSLSDDQAAKLQAADNDMFGKLKALKKDGKKDKADYKKLKDEHQKTVKSILNDQQYTKWEAMKKDVHRKHDGKKGNGKGEKKEK